MVSIRVTPNGESQREIRERAYDKKKENGMKMKKAIEMEKKKVEEYRNERRRTFYFYLGKYQSNAKVESQRDKRTGK